MRDISIRLSTSFQRDFKRLAKRHRSLSYDLKKLIASLKDNPLQGADLGWGCRKVRMAITSKDKGKSGGARVITLTIRLQSDGLLTLLTIYDKSEQGSIDKKTLLRLLKEVEQE